MIATLDQLSKGQVGDVQKVLETICNKKDRELDTVLDERDRPKREMDFYHIPTMQEMCIKYGWPFVSILEQNKRMKLIHNLHKKGYWLGKNRFKHRYTAEIPVQIHGNPRNPLYWIYFHCNCHWNSNCLDNEPYERRKLLYQFLRKYDMAFSPIERL